ncbi:methyltransferase domain-containing protein [Pseudomonas sp. LRP2-20]|uniref:rhamnan synthesis F family protein n=1 Tax=Pseudomonas sp. LRP2-20 TaxID=2944234 RepID=UPI002187DB29|nr:rhamnan synthesis F family protein [Pseudomonas sp. LRP2-20]BDM24263.1 methyltransferase domain-containing protein [Pseudomonas sp. LRP2-20]
MDFVEGKGVDVILDDPYKLPFEDESIDAIVCSSCFEHSDMFWLVFNEILRILKPTGIVYINAPSNGYVHRWPVDCWRFYPDAGNALVTWAKRSGYDPVLLESFIGHRAADNMDGAWNDFVAVFAKSQSLQDQFDKKMLHALEDFDNGRLPGSDELINFHQDPPDFRLIERLRQENASLQKQVDEDAQRAHAAECEMLREQLAAQQQALALAQEELAHAQTAATKATDQLQSLQLQLAQAKEQNKKVAVDFANTLQDIHQSASWKVTGPLRLLSRAVRGERPLVAGGLRRRVLEQIKPVYWAIPPKYRTPVLDWSYRNLDFVFRGSPHYEWWKNGSQAHLDIADVSLIAIDSIEPVDQVQGRIAIHLHMYYEDLAAEFAGHLKHMPFAYDLYVSVKDAQGELACRDAFAKLEQCKALTIKVVENRGRDIAPMFCTFGEALRGYDYIAHLHSKKSLYNAGATEGWREYLSSQLLGSSLQIRRIFSLLNQGKGIVYPQNYKSIPHQANTWLANKAMGTAWCARLGIAPVPQGYFDFPAGSMFWARGDALRPLFDANITITDFVEEAGQTDGTFAHCLERLLGLSGRKQGLPPAILQDMQAPSWSAWRLEQSTARPFQSLVDALANPDIKCIGFDIFDTLICRPLIDAESTKRIVAANLPEHLAAMFSQYRVVAEGEARTQKGADVDLGDIYQVFQQMTRLAVEDVAAIRELEERIEYNSLSARSGGVELFERAKATGKPVVLISDMFLPKALIIQALNAHGVHGWSEFFLSNEVGLRKDTGQLYDHVLQAYGLQPGEFIMVGDNERSDLQVPCDKGCVGLHVLRPTELARGTPRLRRIVERYEAIPDLNAELTLGLLFRKNFQAVVYPDLNPGSLFHATPYNIGYSLLGPMLTGMSQWLIDNARLDGVERLHFLAREGQLMKAVYDVWVQGVEDAPPADYLVVSRRTCSVPLLQTLDDVFALGKGDYYLNTAANYLLERFGLELSDARWSELQAELQIGKDTQVEVRNDDLTPVQPLLTKLADVIFKEASQERDALTLYLKSMGLDAGKNAVVDVGYGATIQNYLCKLTGQPVHGYYLATDERSIPVAEQHGVIARGCLMHNVEHSLAAPIMYLRSFELEKLLSSSDGQVVKYMSVDGVNVEAQHRELSALELEGDAFRAELRDGVLQFAKDALQVRTTLLSSFAPSIEASRALAEEFFSKHSTDELKLLGEVALDDHYCGRGVV